jgi:hypothetical protein
MVSMVSALPPGPVEAPQSLWSSVNIAWTAPQVGGVTELRQTMTLLSPAPQATYFALTWEFTGGTGAYLGLQSDPTSPSPGVTPPPQAANYAIWDARSAVGEVCGPFDGEGVGQRCISRIRLRSGASYDLRVWRSGGRAGRWEWTATVTTGSGAPASTSVVGKIRSPSSEIDPGSVGNFSEYFGDAVAGCGIPRSVVRFGVPGVRSSGASSSLWFDSDRNMSRGPDRCNPSGGANSMVVDSPGGANETVEVTLGGTVADVYQLLDPHGRCLTARTLGDGTRTVGTTACTSSSSRWWLEAPFGEPDPEGLLVGRLFTGGRCLSTVPGSSAVVLTTCSASAGQQWRRVEDGSIRPADGTPRCLTPASRASLGTCRETPPRWTPVR